MSQRLLALFHIWAPLVPRLIPEIRLSEKQMEETWLLP